MIIYKRIAILTLSMSLIALSHGADDMASAKKGMILTDNSEVATWKHNWSTTEKEKRKIKASTASAKVKGSLEQEASQQALTAFAEENDMIEKSYGEVCSAFMENEMAENKRGHRWGKSDSHWTTKSFKVFKARDVTFNDDPLAKSASHLFGKTRDKHNCITSKIGVNDESIKLESMKLR
ncbi:hypothetical protein ACTXLD_07215 [Psychrobacter faecalis]